MDPVLRGLAGVFAALTGLVFVALSMNLKEILSLPGVPGRALEAIVILVEPVLVGLTALLTLERWATALEALLAVRFMASLQVNGTLIRHEHRR